MSTCLEFIQLLLTVQCLFCLCLFFSSEHLQYIRGLLPVAVLIYEHLRVLVLLVLLYL